MVLFSLTSYTAPQVGLRAAPYLEALAVLTDDPVQFEWNGKASPGKVTEGQYTYVVMPVSLE